MRIIFMLFFLFGTAWGQAQSELEQVAPNILVGQWTGNLTQERGGISPKYKFTLMLKLKDGKVSGYSTIEVDGKKGRLSLKGTLKGTEVDLKEIKLTSEDISIKQESWCIKTMNLTIDFRDGKFRLEGKWKGFSNKFGSRCAPGKIYLEKPAIRA